MKIRSITCFIRPEPPFEIQQLQRMGRFISNARQAFEAAGYQVQTTRLATVPLVHLLLEPDIEEAVQLAGKLESQALELGFEYLSLGPALRILLRRVRVGLRGSAHEVVRTGDGNDPWCDTWHRIFPDFD